MAIPQTPLPPVPTEERVRADVRLMLSEITDILTRMCNKLMSLSIGTEGGREGATLRVAVGVLLDNISKSVLEATLPDKMGDVFDAAYEANIRLEALEAVLDQLEAEDPSTNGAVWTAQAGILFSLATESKLVADTTFVSREDIELIQGRMKDNFDTAKEWAADEMDNVTYSKLVDLGARLTRYLADVALPLPTIVYYELKPLPALALSNRIYGDASRYEELMADNKVIHPLFMQSIVRALSN
jgi:hypothetical protein